MAKIGPLELTRPKRKVGFGDIVRNYDVVSVDSELGYMVVKDRSGVLAQDIPDTLPVMGELGGSATRWRRVLGGEEYNPELMGHTGLQTFDRMRRSDATVRQSLTVAKTPVLQGRWWVEPFDPENAQDVEIAEFIERCLFEWMSIGWTQFLTEALLMMDFGYYFFEKVFEFKTYEGQTRLIWKKFAPRHPLDVTEWSFDDHGGPVGVTIDTFEGNSEVFLPIEKLLVFTHAKEAGNIEGISLLRSAYKHWYYKENLYKVDAIQKERHSIGIPVIVLPPNYNNKDKELAEELGRNLRANEKAHVVLPPHWELYFAKIEGNPVDVIKSIEHHDAKIQENVLAGFLGGSTTEGSTDTLVDIFLKASRFTADIIREVINKHAIPELVVWNWPGVENFPKLKVRRIGEVTDLRTLTFALRNLVGADALRPDDKFEEWAREEMDLPRRDPETDRKQEQLDRQAEQQQQGPDQAGLPRQGPPSTGQGEGTGEDRSGGS